MAAQRGLDMLLKIDTNGSANYVTVGGIQAQSLTFNQEDVDITSQDDTSRWRQLLATAGVKSVSFTGSGVFKDDTAYGVVVDMALANTLRNWQITIPSFRTITGPFAVKFEMSGDHNADLKFSITAESAGDLTVASI